MTCCVIGRHPDAADIDRAIRAQQAAARANESTRAPSYSQIARTYGLRKATLLDHRDRCLAAEADRGTDRSGVPVRSEGVPGRTAAASSDENANDSARYERYGAGVPGREVEGADAGGGRATGPPGDGTDRRSSGQRRVPGSAHSGSDRVAQRDADVAVEESSESRDEGGQSRPGFDDARARSSSAAPPERSRPEPRARARTPYDERWDRVGLKSIDAAAQRVTHVINDSELTDPNGPRAHATYVQEIVELIERDSWDGDMTATRLARAWDKPKMFVLGCYRDACTLMRIARGSPNEDREVSLRRWIKLFRAAMDKGDALSMKVAADALKGYDAAAGIVDKSTRVQVNVMQDPAAREFIAEVWDVLRQFPGAPEALRARLEAKRDKLGDPTPILTTGAQVDAAE